jgi:DNA-binding CsgD family transcriptional regulator
MAPASLLLPIPVEIAVGASFIAAGAAAWRLRPANRMGLLMILAGLAWFGRDLARASGEASTRAGELSLNLFLALVAHQVVVFPSGVARSQLGRRLIAAAYALAVGGYVVSEIFPSTNDALAALAIPLIAMIIFDVVERWLGATPPARRTLQPILWAGPPVLVVAALSVAHDYLDVESSSAIDWLKLVYIALPLAFLIGVLRTTLQRTAIGDLVVELSDVASPKLVRDALARTLGDPSLELVYWLPEKNTFIDGSGKPVTLAEGNGRAVLELPGVAALSYDSSLQDDPALVAAVGATARLALENARLQAELQAQLESRRHAEGDQLRVDFLTAPTQPGALSELTTRELEVLALLAEGRTDRGIASALYVTPKTVEAHVRSIFRKLDLPADATMENRRVHAVLTFLRAR